MDEFPVVKIDSDEILEEEEFGMLLVNHLLTWKFIFNVYYYAS